MLLHNKKTQKLIWVVLAILVLPAFLFWGFGSFVRSKEKLIYTTKVFGRRIQPSEYQEAMEAVRSGEVGRVPQFTSSATNMLTHPCAETIIPTVC